METIISSVVALCMFVAGELVEHRIQDKCQTALKEKGKLKEIYHRMLSINVVK